MILPFLGQGQMNPWYILIQVAFFAYIFLFIFYGQRLQIGMWAMEIQKSLAKLYVIKNRARDVSINTVKEVGKGQVDPTSKIDQFLESFFIEPVSMDPSGLVWKFDHLLDVRDMSMKKEVKRIAPEADETHINNLENLLEASMDLNLIYRIVNHYYLFGKRIKSYILLAQLHMILPILMETAYAFDGAIQAFAQGQPIGDGAGPLLVNRLIREKPCKKIEKDMIASELELDGRKVYALKAEGPGGNVGKPGDALKILIDSIKGNLSMVIMVDAGLKLEGDKSGDVIEGIGAAIGGIGTEKYKIEEVTTKYKIPLYAVIIKESLKDAIAPMTKEINDGVDKAIEHVKRIMTENTQEGDVIIIAGIGNSIGIAQ